MFRPVESGSAAATDAAPSAAAAPSPSLNRVRVVVRVRPQPHEGEAAWRELAGASRAIGHGCCVEVDSEDTLTTKRMEYGEERSWRFDHVLSGDATQDDAYDIIARDATADVVAGLSHTILAYGQTGSGKSHTIFGPESFWSQFDGCSTPAAAKSGIVSSEECSDAGGGLVGRAVSQLFRFVAAADAGDCFRVLVSFFEIYNENVHDLLGDCTKSLNVRENRDSGVFVESLRWVAATSSVELLRIVAEGVSKRTLSSTMLNRASSRSHAFLTITFDHKQATDAAAGQQLPVTRGVFTIVDLAGSERVRKSGSVGSTLAEAKSINKSLTTLGMCIAALSSQRTATAARAAAHVPLRDSKLTRLLTDTLEGRTRTTLVVTVSPMAYNFDETKSSLQLAQRAMGVQCSSSVSFAPDDAGTAGDPRLLRRIAELEQENERLRQQLQLLLQQEAPVKFVSATVHQSANGDAGADGDHLSIPAPFKRIIDQREAAIVSKLGAVIQHLQQEIARSAAAAAAGSSDGHNRRDGNKY